jgi:hypothetical protein
MGKTPIPMFFMAITYGGAAAVPAALDPPKVALRVGSSYGMTMLKHRAPPRKNVPKRQKALLNAALT